MDDFDAEEVAKALGSLGNVFKNLGIAIQSLMEGLSVVCNAVIDQYGDPEGEDQEDEDSESAELKPCPFCGKSVACLTTAKELEDCYDYEDEDRCPACMDWIGGCGYHTVVCGMTEGGCGASSGYYSSEEKAIAAWNRRTKEDADADGS